MANRPLRKFLTGRSKGLHEFSLLLLRFGLGMMMIFGHAWPKIDTYELLKFSFADPLGLGRELSLQLVIFAEAVCSLLLLFGLWTRLALLPLLFTMGVVVFEVNASAGFGKLELPLLYTLGFLVLLFLGPGKYAIDER
jgi:putative oxidoreductase